MFQAVVLIVSLFAAVIGAIAGDQAQGSPRGGSEQVVSATMEPMASVQMTNAYRGKCKNGQCETVEIADSDWVDARFCRPNQPPQTPQTPPGFYPAPGSGVAPSVPPQIIPRHDGGILAGIGATLGFIVSVVAAMGGGLTRNQSEKEADARTAEAQEQAQAKERAELLEGK